MVGWKGNIAKITVPTPFSVGDVHLYIVRGDSLTLIDAGVKTKEAWKAFAFQLSQLGYTPEDIDQVVLTHHHPDHIGFLDWLPDEVKIHGHPYNQKWLTNDKAFFEHHDQFYLQLFQEFGLSGDFHQLLFKIKASLKYNSQRPQTSNIQEGDIIGGFEDWQTIETPGHAQSHLVFYREKDGTLLAGDHVLATISSNPLLEPPLKIDAKRPKPQLQYNQSLKRLLNYDIRQTFTGHGPEVRNIHALIEQRIARQRERALQVREMVKGKQMTTFDICKKLFPDVYRKELGLTLSETTAQLDYLLSVDLVEKNVAADNIAYFTAK